MMNTVKHLPKISIIVTVLNKEDMLEKALSSVFTQDYPNLECIVIDGGSTDGTLNIIKKYASLINYWVSEPDRGAAEASNKGIQRASGDLIAFLMADDWYEPRIFQKIGETYQQDPTADIYTCAGDEVKIDNKTGELILTNAYYQPASLQLKLTNLLFANYGFCFRFYKRVLFEKLGLFEVFDQNGTYCFSNDRHFLLKAALAEVKDIFVPQLGYHYLIHAGSATFSNNRKTIKRCLDEHRNIAVKFLKNNNLSSKQQLLFHYWYNDQTARLIVYELLDNNYQQAALLFGNIFKSYPIFFPISFMITTLRLLKKSLAEIIKKLKNHL